MKADLVVLGSGFGGCLCALIAERLGLETVVIDRARHPRFTIGESSTPTADLILRDLCDRYDLARLKPLATWGSWQRAYPDVLGGLKRGFSYVHHQEGRRFVPDPDHTNELFVAASASDETSDTQWYRADVDAFFANEVRRAGIPLLEEISVEPVRAGEGWRLDGAGVTADFVIDATGAGGALVEALGLADSNGGRTCTRAVFSHFAGVPRWREHAASVGAAIDDYPFDPDWSALHHVVDGGWMWMLRFKNDLLSAGWVLDARAFRLDEAVSPQEEWERLLRRVPALEELFVGARLAPVPGAVARTRRLQRRVVGAAGANWALLPHTAGFVDPLHSTGIAHTMSGVERLMGVLEANWGRGELPAALEDYQRDVLDELAFVDDLVVPCYRSIGSFERWTASTMLYFAAATSYERLRAARSGAAPRFLLAGDERLREIAREASRRVAASDYADWLERELEPYNHVGLFRPRIPNMYEHTAAVK